MSLLLISPTFSGIVKDGVRQFEWFDVGMVDYSKQLYTVKVINISQTEDKSKKKKPNEPLKAALYTIPRIRLMFQAEDPNVFVARVKEAFNERKKIEALLRSVVNVYWEFRQYSEW